MDLDLSDAGSEMRQSWDRDLYSTGSSRGDFEDRNDDSRLGSTPSEYQDYVAMGYIDIASQAVLC